MRSHYEKGLLLPRMSLTAWALLLTTWSFTTIRNIFPRKGLNEVVPMVSRAIPRDEVAPPQAHSNFVPMPHIPLLLLLYLCHNPATKHSCVPNTSCARLLGALHVTCPIREIALDLVLPIVSPKSKHPSSTLNSERRDQKSSILPQAFSSAIHFLRRMAPVAGLGPTLLFVW